MLISWLASPTLLKGPIHDYPLSWELKERLAWYEIWLRQHWYQIGLGLKACSQLKPKRTWNIATATLGSNRKRMSLGIRLHPSVNTLVSTTRFYMLAPEMLDWRKACRLSKLTLRRGPKWNRARILSWLKGTSFLELLKDRMLKP